MTLTVFIDICYRDKLHILCETLAHPLAVMNQTVKNVLVNLETTGFNTALHHKHHRDSEPSIYFILLPPWLSADVTAHMPGAPVTLMTCFLVKFSYHYMCHGFEFSKYFFSDFKDSALEPLFVPLLKFLVKFEKNIFSTL